MTATTLDQIAADGNHSLPARWLAPLRLTPGVIGPQTLLLGCVAMVLWSLGGLAIERVSISAGFEPTPNSLMPIDASVHDVFYGPLTVSAGFVDWMAGQASWFQRVLLACRFAWGLLLCAVFGGAICRSVGLRYATERAPAMADVFAFTLPRTLQSWLAPVLPVLGCGVLSLFLFVFQVVTWLPWVGDYIYAAVSFCLTGMMWALVLLSALSWPLMFAAQSVEHSDCFDGLSRAFNFLLTRPLQYGLHLVSFAVFGFGGCYLVQAGLMVLVGDSTALNWFQTGLLMIPAVLATTAFFAWSTLSFLELRRQIDATETDEVYIPGATRTEAVPLVGRAAHPVLAEAPTAAE